MRSFLSLPTYIGIIAVPLFALACSSSPAQSSGDGGGAEASGSMDGGSAEASGPISFQTDLLPAFERGCGLSSSCHQDQVLNPKVQRVFLGCNPTNPNCTAPDGGPLSSGPIVYPELMGVSQEAPPMHYVAPNDPANSYLLRKLENNLSNVMCVLPVTMDPILQTGAGQEQPPLQPCGASMPLNLPAITDLNAMVRAWIMQGAQNN